MKKKSFLLSFLILFALLALVGCKKHPSGETLSKVTLNEVAHSIFYAPQYVAIQEGYFAEEGIDLNLVTGFGADKTMTAVLLARQTSALWELRQRSMPMPKEPKTPLSTLLS